ncbi:MAG: hypothetical protein HQ582_05100, partial [Planctomycetes bacterium]|nr:hypothetical protein [Planctomycetota bacterium]
WPRRRPVAVLGAIALVGIAVAVWLVQRPPAPPTPAPSDGPKLTATRIAPPPEVGEIVDAPRFETVEFFYELHNEGTEPIRGLKLDLACRCQLKEPPPEEILPGETARVGFSIRAPDMGVIRRPVELIATETGKPVLQLEVAVRVKLDPPALVATPKPTLVTFVEGDETSRELVVETIEERDSEPWIEAMEIRPEHVAEVKSMQLDERPQLDSSLVRRAYRFQICCPSDRGGSHHGTFALLVRCDPAATPAPVPLEVRVLDRVDLLPNPVRIKGNPGETPSPRRVAAVYRLGRGAIEVAQFDETLLDVQPVRNDEGAVVAFDLLPKAAIMESIQTEVTFRVDGGDTRELAVRFEPDPAR